MNRVQSAICATIAEIGLTLAEAAVQIGLDRRYLIDFVSRLDPGELPVTACERLARLTGVPAFVFRASAGDAARQDSGLLHFSIRPHLAKESGEKDESAGR